MESGLSTGSVVVDLPGLLPSQVPTGRRGRQNPSVHAEDETSIYFRPRALPGVEALHATFVAHTYRPHSHPTWTIAVVEAGAAQFSVETLKQRADAGELFVLEPDAIHTGMAAV